MLLYFITVQEKIDVLNDRLERECYGSGERSLPPGDLTDYPDTKNLSKQKCKTLLYCINILHTHTHVYIYIHVFNKSHIIYKM